MANIIKPGLIGLKLSEYGLASTLLTGYKASGGGISGDVWILEYSITPQPIGVNGIWTNNGIWKSNSYWYS